jgi:hypothetical protein
VLVSTVVFVSVSLSFRFLFFLFLFAFQFPIISDDDVTVGEGGMLEMRQGSWSYSVRAGNCWYTRITERPSPVCTSISVLVTPVAPPCSSFLCVVHGQTPPYNTFFCFLLPCFSHTLRLGLVWCELICEPYVHEERGC